MASLAARPAMAQDAPDAPSPSASPGTAPPEEPTIEPIKYPRVTLNGYLETAYEIESFANGSIEPPDTFNAFARTPFHIGQVKLLANFELSDNVDGLIEVFPWPKGNPAEYDGEYRDIVGNNAPSPFTVAGRIQTNFRNLWYGSNWSFGQIRVPFGIWDDFSVHRKLFDAKSDQTIFGGSPLRRIDTGASVDGNFGSSPISYRLAVVGRADNPDKINNYSHLTDTVGRLGWHGEFGDVGLSAYVADVKEAAFGQKGALGIDYTLFLPLNLSLIGEAIDQEDMTQGAFSRGIYTRLNYDWSDYLPGLRTFVGYEHTNASYLLIAAPVSKNYESKAIIGARYRFMNGLTIGSDYFQGDEYPGGHLHIRLETQF